MSSMERSLQTIEAAIRTPQSRAFYQQHVTSLQGFWQTISTTHHELLAEDDLSTSVISKYIELEGRYHATSIKLMELNEGLTSSATNGHTADSRQPSMVKLPKISIPAFSGDYSRWKQFHDLFVSLIHNQPISNSQKMFYLKSNLTGEPSRLIQHLQVSEENYTTAWELLKNRFDNKRLIVASFLNRISSIPTMSGESAGALKRLHDIVNEALLGIQNQGVDTKSWDALLLHLLIQKLDRETHRLFEQSLDSPRNIPTLTGFLQFVESRFQLLETLGDNRKERKDGKRSSTLLASRRLTTCTLCKRQHASLGHCTVFTKLPPVERTRMAKKLHCCLNCLKQGHVISKCPSRGCLKCNARHNTLLHDAEASTSIREASTRSNSSEPLSSSHRNTETNQSVHAVFNEEPRSFTYVFLGTALINIKDAQGEKKPCRTILDSGSQLNFVSERLVRRLGVKTSHQDTDINGIGHLKLQVRGRVNLSIYSRLTGFSARIEAFILPEITSNQPTQFLNTATWPIPRNIQLADPEFDKPRKVDMLLGAEIYCDLMSIGQIRLSTDLPTLQNSVFGWIVQGKYSRPRDGATAFCGISTASLHNQLEKFWTIEECEPVKKAMTEMERACEIHFSNHTHRQQDGRFVVRLPFKEPSSSLGKSEDIAIRRFQTLERRLERLPEIKKQYVAFMQELLDLKHMEPVQKVPNQNYFLPHHCVLNPNSSTTKLRVVFDGSCKTSTNRSLNDTLHIGPTIQDDLFTILLRFRLHTYVFTADITKMYRQVLVHEDDRNFQMIVWRNSPTDALQYYRLRTVTYGTSAAPYLATKCLHRLAEEEANTYPLGARILKRDFYVDDVMTGSNSLEEAIKIQAQLRSILTKGGFPLRKWCANHSALLQQVPKNDIELLLDITGDHDNETKALGLIWYPKHDKFSIKTSLSDSKKVNKRSILADISSIFDPLGLVNPVITLGKIFMQKLWKLKLDWDQAIPQELHSSWLAFREDLRCLKGLAVPRHVLSKHNPTNIQIHAFSDASEMAYGVAVYLRSTDQYRQPTVKLLCAKSRVAPTKITSLPRLELSAAHLAVKLVKRLKYSLQITADEIHFWTDSAITLHWIKAETSSYRPFVANRVAYIQENTKENHWHHVPSKQNPADLTSRGLTARQLLTATLWFEGPGFLKLAPTTWPKFIPASVNVPGELRKTTTVLSITKGEDSILHHINHRGSFKTLQHVVAYILRFTRAILRKEYAETRVLQPTEQQQALHFIIRVLQREAFSEDLGRINKGKSICSKSKIKSLTPFIDNEGLLRVGGRIQAANIPYDAKHPLLLPKGSQIVRLLMTHLHQTHLHAGPQALLSITRQQFWPIHGKRLAQTIVRSCVRCSRIKPKLITQLMGNLPPERIQPSRPFINTGVDFAGPIYIHYKIRGKRPTKAYIAVFICFNTRAVHLELVSDLTKDAFIGALKRFIGRRGRPQKLFCDNATNFVGAKNELEDVKNLFTKEEVQNDLQKYCSEEYIQWCFIPPRTPHFGGLWEAAVKSAKYHLRRILMSASLTYEELHTIIIEVEAALNSRPLTPLSVDPNDVQALTPAHFLIGEPLTTLPNPQAREKNENLLQRWELVKGIQRTFWKRWSEEYLNQLQQRVKWKEPANPIKPGMLVILKDKDLPPLKWALGRVIQEMKGADGHTRVVEIKTEKGKTQRAIHNVCPLPTEEASSDTRSTTTHTRKEERVTTTTTTPPASNIGKNKPDSTQTRKDQPSATSLLSTHKGYQILKEAPRRKLPTKGRFLPINPSWRQAPFKPSTALMKFNRQQTDPSVDEPETKKPRQERRMAYHGTKLMNLLLTICFVLFPSTYGLESKDSVEITPWEHTPILFFEDIAHMSMATDTWNIMVYYDLDGYWKEFNILTTQINKLRDMCQQADFLRNAEQCRVIPSQFDRQLEIMRDNNDILLRRHGNAFRAKRSPLDIIGNVANKLFGVLDQEYADQMSDTIKKINENEDYLLKLVKNQTSILNSTANIIKQDQEYTDAHLNIINDYIDRLQLAINKTNTIISQDEAIQMFNSISIHSTLILLNYQNVQTALIGVVTDSNKGKINPLLLTPQQLQTEIQIIREHLPSTLQLPGRASHEDLLQLYGLMTVKTRVSRKYVLFNVQLPLLNKETFQIFKIFSLPIQIKNKIFQVKTSTDFLAVNLHRDSYYLMSEDELSECIICLDGNYICRKRHTLFHKNAGQAKCELSILNQQDSLPEDCILEQLATINPWTQLYESNTWIYYLPESTTVNIVCGTSSYQRTINGSGLLKFNAACTIKHDTLTISSHNRYESNINNSFTPSMTLNASIIQTHLTKQEAKLEPHREILRNNTRHIKQVQEAIKKLEEAQYLPAMPAATAHQFSISYLALTLAIILIIIFAVQYWKNKQGFQLTPQPTSRRSVFQLNRVEHPPNVQRAGVC